MKDELGGKIMKEFVPHGPTMNSYFENNGCVEKKTKGKMKCVIE